MSSSSSTSQSSSLPLPTVATSAPERKTSTDFEPSLLAVQEKIIQSNFSTNEMSLTTVNLLDTPPDTESSAKCSENEDSPPKDNPKTIPSPLPEMDNNSPTVCWNDVTSRAKALST